MKNKENEKKNGKRKRGIKIIRYEKQRRNVAKTRKFRIKLN